VIEYTVPDVPSLEQWADETLFIISDPAITVSALIADCIKPSPFVTGYFLAHTNQFVLHTAHWRTDGPGALQLLGALFDALASELTDSAAGKALATHLAWGEEPDRLPPSIEEALGLPVDPTPDITTATAACLATGRLVAGSVGLPYQADAVPGATRWIRHTFSSDESDAVLAACREYGLRPLAAVHASLAAANFAGAGGSISSVASPQTAKVPHYTSTMRFSLRPYLLSGFSTSSDDLSRPNPALAVPSLYTGNYMTAIPAGCSWRDAAARYETLYSEGLSHEFLMARRQFAGEALENLQRMAAVKVPAGGGRGPPPRSEIDMSSVDNADEFIAPLHSARNPNSGGEFEADTPVVHVESIGLGVECMAKETYLFFWVFRGRLELNLTYNKAFYEEDFMKRMLDVVKTSLAAGLDIKLALGN
jgi:hypothetical protein